MMNWLILMFFTTKIHTKYVDEAYLSNFSFQTIIAHKILILEAKKNTTTYKHLLDIVINTHIDKILKYVDSEILNRTQFLSSKHLTQFTDFLRKTNVQLENELKIEKIFANNDTFSMNTVIKDILDISECYKSMIEEIILSVSQKFEEFINKQDRYLIKLINAVLALINPSKPNKSSSYLGDIEKYLTIVLTATGHYNFSRIDFDNVRSRLATKNIDSQIKGFNPFFQGRFHKGIATYIKYQKYISNLLKRIDTSISQEIQSLISKYQSEAQNYLSKCISGLRDSIFYMILEKNKLKL